MDALQAFCHSKRLTVKIEQTKAIGFSRTPVSLVLTYQGQQQVEQGQFSPLGLDLHQSKGFTFCTSHLLAAARKALFGLKQKCMQLHITDARLQCSLSDTLVIPGWLSVFCPFWKIQTQHSRCIKLDRAFIPLWPHQRMAASQCFMFGIRSVLSKRNEVG